ncbi:MAG: ubiquinone/menaquinone biosynthesis methyltransferase [Bacteriovoracaceae bacterium]|nr:ubiquinone/menaquinone biosynthesis methyltransferase [Bacteriovoracaceae bacterium]
MFDDISDKYDLLNDVLSLGIHRLWKKKLANKILSRNPDSFLDCATGTGDVAKLIHDKSVKTQGIDFSPNMIEMAKKRNPQIAFQVDDLMGLSFEDKSFDASNVSFGIRNVEEVSKALSEMARVSNKSVFVMEFGQPENKFFKSIYFMIMKHFIPAIGKIFNREKEYEYLIESSSTFPSGKKFLEIMKSSTNFKTFKATPLFGGVVYIYEAHNE